MDILVILALVVLVILMFTYIPSLFRENDTPKVDHKAKTKLGVNKLHSTVKRYALRQQYKVLGPCRFEKDGKTADIDCILIGYFGVLAIKALGRNGEVYGDASQEEWLQVVKEGRYQFENPMREAERAVPMMRKMLDDANVRGVMLEVVTVSSYKHAQLIMPKSTGVLTLREFGVMLEKQKYREDKGVNLEQVETAFRPALRG